MGTLIKPTTLKYGGRGGAYTLVQARYAAQSGWKPVKGSFKGKGGVWVGTYSTPDVNCGGGGAATASGASGSGTASVGATAANGGYWVGSLAYGWTYVSGDSGIAPNNVGIQKPDFFARLFRRAEWHDVIGRQRGLAMHHHRWDDGCGGHVPARDRAAGVAKHHSRLHAFHRHLHKRQR